MFKVNNKDTRTTSMTSFWYLYCSGVFTVNVEHISPHFLVFPQKTLNKQMPAVKNVRMIFPNFVISTGCKGVARNPEVNFIDALNSCCWFQRPNDSYITFRASRYGKGEKNKYERKRSLNLLLPL